MVSSLSVIRCSWYSGAVVVAELGSSNFAIVGDVGAGKERSSDGKFHCWTSGAYQSKTSITE